jgi:hypothetical protein
MTLENSKPCAVPVRFIVTIVSFLKKFVAFVTSPLWRIDAQI